MNQPFFFCLACADVLKLEHDVRPLPSTVTDHADIDQHPKVVAELVGKPLFYLAGRNTASEQFFDLDQRCPGIVGVNKISKWPFEEFVLAVTQSRAEWRIHPEASAIRCGECHTGGLLE